MIYLVKMFIICSEFSAESMQGYDTVDHEIPPPI
jgi:hypothetical protein